MTGDIIGGEEELPMGEAFHSFEENIDRDGFAIIRSVYSLREIAAMIAAVDDGNVKRDDGGHAVRRRNGTMVAARNVLDWMPSAGEVWRVPALLDPLSRVLGSEFGLVRVLYFDKPPGESWGLPWHKDLTIAVRDNRLPSSVLSNPTVKSGVPHVEAPTELLAQMLTLRIFLDDVTESNGPLRVIPGSHRTGKDLDLAFDSEVPLLGKSGDVLAIRPLVAHTSGHSATNSTEHRRTLHLEFCGRPDLPDGFAWFQFLRGLTIVTATA